MNGYHRFGWVDIVRFRQHPDNFQFCPVTGEKLESLKACTNRQCPDYGKYVLPLDSRFCPTCGAKIEGENDSSERTFTINGVSFDMVLVKAGTFTMGATPEQEYPYDDEKLAHQVTLTRSYYMGKTQVTQALWKAVMGDNPSCFEGDNKPVEQVSWDDCQEFISELNAATGKNFRLPTEAEWEFAARGGNKSNHYQYSGSDNIDDVAWYDDNSGDETHYVASKQPNELGIYDMSGNVWEWCSDWYGGYSSKSQTNPTGAKSGSYRVNRGGGWSNLAGYCRSSGRSLYSPGRRDDDLGLRLALPVQP